MLVTVNKSKMAPVWRQHFVDKRKTNSGIAVAGICSEMRRCTLLKQNAFLLQALAPVVTVIWCAHLSISNTDVCMHHHWSSRPGQHARNWIRLSYLIKRYMGLNPLLLWMELWTPPALPAEPVFHCCLWRWNFGIYNLLCALWESKWTKTFIQTHLYYLLKVPTCNTHAIVFILSTKCTSPASLSTSIWVSRLSYAWLNCMHLHLSCKYGISNFWMTDLIYTYNFVSVTDSIVGVIHSHTTESIALLLYLIYGFQLGIMLIPFYWSSILGKLSAGYSLADALIVGSFKTLTVGTTESSQG